MQFPPEDRLIRDHRADLPSVEEVDQEGLDDIVPVVGKGDLVAAPLRRDLEDPLPPETGTEKAGVFPVVFAVGKGTDVRLFQDGVIAARVQMPHNDPAAGAVRVEAGIDVDGHE